MPTEDPYRQTWNPQERDSLCCFLAVPENMSLSSKRNVQPDISNYCPGPGGERREFPQGWGASSWMSLRQSLPLWRFWPASTMGALGQALSQTQWELGNKMTCIKENRMTITTK